jgi:vacuolar iron transporter family protein
MMREELGFRDAFEAPWRSSLAVGLSYLVGAFVPVIPYLFVSPAKGIIYSAIATLCTLFAVGAAKTVITTRSLWRSGLESVVTGAIAAVATFGAGYYLWR